jgi:hypothetical protein
VLELPLSESIDFLFTCHKTAIPSATGDLPTDHSRLQRRNRESIMSRASKLTLLGTSLLTVGTVVAVHFQQKFEQAVRFPLLN